MATARKRGSVVVLYNSVSDEGYEKLRDVDPETLGFKPEYDIAVSTVAEEYAAIVDGLKEAGFQAREVNIAEDIKKLERLVRRNPPDAVFNLVEGFHDDADLEPAVAGFLDLYRIPYTGAPPIALANCRRKGLMTASTLKAVEQAYEVYRQGDLLPASYEVVYGQAWVPSKK